MEESRGGYRVLVGSPEGSRPLERPSHRWEDTITRWFKYDRDKCGLFTHKSVPVIFEPPCRMNLRDVGWGTWTGLIWFKMETWCAFVNAVMNLWVL
jgi:hypothetical protein